MYPFEGASQFGFSFQLSQHVSHFRLTIGERLSGHAQAIQHRHKQVGQWCLLVIAEILVVLEPKLTSTGQDQRVIVILVSPAIAAAVEDHGVVQQITITLGSIFQTPRK